MKNNVHKLKSKLHQELKIRYKEYFESKLAVAILNSYTDRVVINKISTFIVQSLKQNEKFVREVVLQSKKIHDELSAPYFGALFHENEIITTDDLLKKIHITLTNKNSDLKNIMQIHCIFIQKIYDQIATHHEKEKWANKLFVNSLFNEREKIRLNKNENKIHSTAQLGIANLSVFAKLTGQSTRQHVRALDKFTLNPESNFFKTTQEKNIPTVCGPSGHTGSLLLGAKLYGNLSHEELQEYTWLIFAFLTAGGNHSFHEVVLVANQIDLQFEINHYAKNIPATFKDKMFYQQLVKQFPEFLCEESIDENRENKMICQR